MVEFYAKFMHVLHVLRFLNKENVSRNLFSEGMLEQFPVIHSLLMLSEQSLHLLHQAKKTLQQLLRSSLIHAKIIFSLILEGINFSLLKRLRSMTCTQI